MTAANENVAVVPYFTSGEAASYLRYRDASGIRAAVRRRELIPDGAGPRGVHLFTRETLDSFVRVRAQSLGRLVSRPVLAGVGHGISEGNRETGNEQVRDPRTGNMPATGRRKEVRSARECTLTEARALQYQWRDELIESMRSDKASRVRLRDFVTAWLDGRKDKIKRTTALKIADVWDGHIATAVIADLYIDEITIEDVEAWIESLRARKYIPGKGKASKRKTCSDKSKPRAYSAGTIKGYYRVLAQILKAACARARVANPCDGIEPLAAGKRRKNFLALDEVGDVLAHVEKHSPLWYPAVLLDVVSGLRWGELSALRWDDIDEAEGVIRVRRGNDKGRVVSSTKTGDDEDEPKIVPLLPQVAEVLGARRKQMVADQHPGLAEGWIFPTEKGTLHKGSPLRDVLDAACADCKTKRRITTHGLRHTANDLLRRVADGEVVRAIIGHSTPQMTHHYSHVDETEKRTAATRAFAVMTGGKGVGTGVASAASACSRDEAQMKNPPLPAG